MTNSDSTAQRDLETVVRAQWPSRPWKSVALDGGMTNRNWRVTVESDSSGAREDVAVQLLLSNELAARIGINRHTQKQVMPIVEELKLGPKLVAWRQGNPCALITDFLENAGTSGPEDRSRVITLAAAALSRLHKSTRGTRLRNYISDPFDGAEWLFRRVEELIPQASAPFTWAIELSRRCQRARGTYEPCLLHADLSVGNVLVSQSGVSLIDWEYAGGGDRFFDCGDFAEKWELSAVEERQFADEYNSTGDSLEYLLAALRMYRFHSRLREALWAAAASTTHFTEFDHSAYSRACMTRLDDIAASKAFQDSLSLVKATTEIKEVQCS